MRLIVNDVTHEGDPEDRTTLADYLRDALGLTGTHLGCEHGVCGACTVLLDGQPVRSCLVLARQAEDSRVETVEGLADGDDLHPLQSTFSQCHALQCGFCTPGFLMLITGTIDADHSISDEELQEVLSSNLCRCTGYEPIREAAIAYRDLVASQSTTSMPRSGGEAS